MLTDVGVKSCCPEGNTAIEHASSSTGNRSHDNRSIESGLVVETTDMIEPVLHAR